ncbi:MAG: hypothetical protein KDK10_06445 [Maritimibacter sp.]|nr:hypothetical protein [Maritimibacter sp.]
MEKRTGHVPDTVHRAAETAWGKWKNKLAFAKAPKAEDDLAARSRADAEALKSPEQRMIEKIKLRMTQLPDWYETDPAKVAKLVAAELERIGTVLDAKLAEAEEPVEVWQIPLSVFNWLVDTPTGEGFVHGALKAWSSAENFNAANAAQCDEAQRAKLRAPFLELAPLRLRAVLEELLATGLVVTFAEKFVGPELKYLVMRVQSPVEERKRR